MHVLARLLFSVVEATICVFSGLQPVIIHLVGCQCWIMDVGGIHSGKIVLGAMVIMGIGGIHSGNIVLGPMVGSQGGIMDVCGTRRLSRQQTINKPQLRNRCILKGGSPSQGRMRG